jgi:hypothetical protein
MSDYESDLILKVFTNYHLNVAERKTLPAGKMRASKARMLIEKSLKGTGWFPGNSGFPRGNDTDRGAYTQLEMQGNTVILHHNYESSMLNYSHKTEKFSSLSEGIEAFLKARENNMDGLAIDWQA